jgi:hypothetical protein
VSALTVFVTHHSHAYSNTWSVDGAQGCVWGESVWPSTLASLTWPRASVLAERLWLPDPYFGRGNKTNGKGVFPPLWRGKDKMDHSYYSHVCPVGEALRTPFITCTATGRHRSLHAKVFHTADPMGVCSAAPRGARDTGRRSRPLSEEKSVAAVRT